MDSSEKWAYTIAAIFAAVLLGGNFYYAAEEPVVISLADKNSIGIYNTTVSKIDTHDLFCQFDEEFTGIPLKVSLKGGEMNDWIFFSDNYTVRTMDTERYNWKNFQGKIIKVRKSCYGYLRAVEVQSIK